MSATANHADMPYRVLGRTGERVSAIGLGGWHLGLKHVDEPLGIRIVRSAIDRGITFMDNSWDYNEGRSEIRMGKVLRDGYREKVFLMTKIDGRSKSAAARQLDESLRRLQTDRIDLVQHHEILRYKDPHRIFHEEGANAALMEARQAASPSAVGSSQAQRVTLSEAKGASPEVCPLGSVHDPGTGIPTRNRFAIAFSPRTPVSRPAPAGARSRSAPRS